MPAISPPRFPDWTEVRQIRDFADHVRDRTGGIPIGYKLSAQHLEKDIDVILGMAHDTKAVHVSLLKDHDNPDISDLKLALDPTTMLLIKER